MVTAPAALARQAGARVEDRRRRLGIGAAVPVLLLVAATGVAAVRWPYAVLLGLAAALGVAVMLAHLERSALAYVAIEPFGDLIGTVQPAAIKVAGALLFLAWLLRLVLDARPVNLRHPGMVAAGLLALVVLASTVAQAGRHEIGLEVAIRYASYLAVLAVLVDTLRASAAPAARSVAVRRMAAVYTLSATASGVVGLVGFLAEGGRAAGPLSDANDFAFFLMTAVPFALWLAAERGWLGRLFGVCAVLLIVATLATFSRGAMLGLALMLVLAVALRLVRARVVLIGLAAVVAAVGLTWMSASEVIDRSLGEKQHVAAANVDSRFTSWEMAAAMTADSPLLGQGPGGFSARGDDYVPAGVADTTHLDVAHQMYLDVSSELDLLGLGAFVALIALAGRGAWRARRVAALASDLDPGAGTATVVALAGVLVAACFLTEQYYLPIWLLAAFGIALDPTPDVEKAI